MSNATQWTDAKAILGNDRVSLGPVATHSWLHQPEHLAFQLARYRAASALIGDAQSVLEVGCGEGIGAGILAKGRTQYVGIDNDGDALAIAAGMHARSAHVMGFVETNATRLTDPLWLPGASYEAVVSLDVVEHVAADQEDAFMYSATRNLRDHGVCVIGTPNAAFDHLASPQSKAGHINLYTHDRLHALMSRYFAVVQSFGLQDTSLHLGHPEARHYLLMAGIGVRR